MSNEISIFANPVEQERNVLKDSKALIAESFKELSEEIGAASQENRELQEALHAEKIAEKEEKAASRETLIEHNARISREKELLEFPEFQKLKKDFEESQKALKEYQEKVSLSE